MELAKIDIRCDQCNQINTKYTGYIHGYAKTILKSFWCEYCGQAQVVRFMFIGKQAEVIERLEPSHVYVPYKPDTGITIRPRSSSKH